MAARIRSRRSARQRLARKPNLAEGALAQGTYLAEDARDGDPLGAEHREPIPREQACGGREKREVALELGSGGASVDVFVHH